MSDEYEEGYSCTYCGSEDVPTMPTKGERLHAVRPEMRKDGHACPYCCETYIGIELKYVARKHFEIARMLADGFNLLEKRLKAKMDEES